MGFSVGFAYSMRKPPRSVGRKHWPCMMFIATVLFRSLSNSMKAHGAPRMVVFLAALNPAIWPNTALKSSTVVSSVMYEMNSVAEGGMRLLDLPEEYAALDKSAPCV